MAFNYASVAGAGVSEIDDSILGMPLLNVIQTGSPQVKKSHKDFATKGIPGAREGDIVFAPLNTVLPQPVKAILLASTTLYTEWRPKSSGGGFIGNKPLSIVSDRNYCRGPAGTPDEYKEYLGDNELQYTVFAAIKFLDGVIWRKGFISFTSTELKTAREWMKAVKRLRFPGHPDLEPPIFAGLWNLTTGPKLNKKGDWMGWNITLDRVLDAEADEALLTESSAAFTQAQLSLPAPKAVVQAGEATIVDGKDPLY